MWKVQSLLADRRIQPWFLWDRYTKYVDKPVQRWFYWGCLVEIRITAMRDMLKPLKG